MTFDSVVFWLFFPLAWILWAWLPFRLAKGAMLVLSFVFYGWWNPWYLILLLGSTVLDYIAGAKVYQATEKRRKRAWLTASIVSNLGLLAFFKYGGFISQNLGAALGMKEHVPVWQFVVPVGISFYTFQVLSYSLDIYRGRLKPAGSFWEFLQFVAFFPHLVAGPIVRAHELLPQFRRRRRLSPAAFQLGLYYIICGLFLKMVVADNLAPAVEHGFDPARLSKLSLIEAWLVVGLFAGQIFADFAGYSAVAIGLALMMGIRFPRNFNYPYLSASLSEFWTRWHITLSQWFRDYLYIPLGGNRKGSWRTYLNLMVTMLVAGFWHGAAWTYLAWGGLHGLGLCVERCLGGGTPTGVLRTAGRGMAWGASGLRLVRMAIVLVFVLVTWVFFRAPTFSVAGQMLKKMFLVEAGQPLVWPWWQNRYLLLLTPIFLLHVAQGLHEWLGIRKSTYWRAASAGVMLFLLLVISREAERVFIYFQF